MTRSKPLGPLALALLLAPALAACGGGGKGNTGGGGHTSSSTNSTSSGVTCQGTQTACGEVCADLQNDPMHCGACETACDSGAQCCTGVCVTTAACSFSVTEAKPNTGWQNGGDYLDLTGQGFVKGMQVFIGDGRAAVLVKDANTARIKTPPGPLGVHDIKIVSGASTAVLKNAFTYQSAGLNTPWQQKPMMTVRGEDPGVAVMQDARVLIAGGTTVPDSTAMALDTAEIYTRNTDMVTTAVNTMSTRRWQNSAITLLDGHVLVVGGACYADLSNCNGADPTLADLFDPTTDTFAPSASKLSVGRAYTRSTLLPDGRVLIASANDPSFDVYDPETDTFTGVPNTGSGAAHVFGFMALLRDGRVLIGAGDKGNTAVDIFDPDTNKVTAGPPLNQGRSMLTTQTLPDGRVLVIGGSSQSAGGITDPLDTIEAYDPVANTFTTLPYKLSIGRTWHASALVRDGTILVAGGYTAHGDCNSLIDTVDQIDPVAGNVMLFATLPNRNTEWVAVTLLDGSVLGVGGGACGTSMALPDIDFLPGANVPH